MLNFALRNLFRHKGRTGLSLAAVVFGVVSVILSGGFIEDVFFSCGKHHSLVWDICKSTAPVITNSAAANRSAT